MPSSVLAAVLIIGAISSCSGSAPIGGNRAQPSKAPDAPAFVFTDADVQNGILTATQLSAVAKRAVQMDSSSQLPEVKNWVSTLSLTSDGSSKCTELNSRLRQIHGDALSGTTVATDSDGNPYGLGFVNLSNNSQVRKVLAVLKTIYLQCRNSSTNSTATLQSTTVKGGFGVLIKVNEQKFAFADAGYGSLILYGVARDQSKADEIVAAARKHLDVVAASGRSGR